MDRLACTFALILSVSAACGGSKGGSSSTPTTPTPTATRIIRLEGDLAFGNIQVGSSFEATLRIFNSGTDTLTVTGMTVPSGSGSVFATTWSNGTIGAGANQAVTIRFTPTDARTWSGTLTVNANHTSGTNTVPISGTGTFPPGPRIIITAGTHLIGTDILAGRYFADPSDGCYWERLSGLGGTLGEILANDFVGFNAAQLIVDIRASDRAFRSDSECGTWRTSAPHGAQATIAGGAWLVNNQIAPGTYRADARDGCYWERLRDFTGTLGGIIANNFVSGGGQQLVTIGGSDVGFYTDDDCGSWTRVQTIEGELQLIATPQQIERDRDLYRSRRRQRE